MVLVPPLTTPQQTPKHHLAMPDYDKTVCAQFTKAQSIQRGFYKGKMKDEEKSLPRHWQLITNFFTTPLPILVRCKTKAQSELCATYCAIDN